jgi:DnaK suppressor protein
MDEHTPKERQQIAGTLQVLEQDLMSFIEDVAGATETVELDQGQQGRLSRIDAMQAQKMAEAQRDRAIARLQRVRNILETTEEDDFGCCGDCGETIPLKRLLARPDSVLCVECAGARER